MERTNISDEDRKYFPRTLGTAGHASVPRTGKKLETLRDEIERKTAEFLADGGEIESCKKGQSNYTPTVQIVINSDKDRPANRTKRGNRKK